MDEWAPDCLSEEASSENLLDEDEMRIPGIRELKSRMTSQNVYVGEKSNGSAIPQDCAGSFNIFSSVVGDKNNNRKKPFDISRDKHKSIPNGVSPEVINRHNKRSRVDMEESFDRFGNLGRPIKEKIVGDSGTVIETDSFNGLRFDLNRKGSPFED
ncbi:hypothetical protein Hanom_Chr08g00706191 [Helianthus anomalus]